MLPVPLSVSSLHDGFSSLPCLSSQAHKPMPLANWGAIAQQSAIKFEDRFKLL